MSNNPRVAILGVPLDLGQTRRGVDMGPSALRYAGLGAGLRALGKRVEDDGDVDVDLPERREAGDRHVRYAAEIAGTCRLVAERVAERLDAGWTPLVLGGDHSLAIGTLAGVARSLWPRNETFGCIWLDAHGDLNTPETTPSGNVHGMPLAYALGLGTGVLAEFDPPPPFLSPRNVAVVGARDLDPAEREVVKSTGLEMITMREIDEQGIGAALEKALRVATDGTAGYHLGLDLDFLDPQEAPGVGTPSRGGVTYREAHLAMEMIADSGRLISIDVVEVNPILDVGNQTAELAVELALSALGKRIL